MKVYTTGIDMTVPDRVALYIIPHLNLNGVVWHSKLQYWKGEEEAGKERGRGRGVEVFR